MRLLLAMLLLLSLAPPAAAQTPLVVPTIDVTDATGDARAYPDVRLAQSDIARFTSRLEGEEIVQTVHVVGPWPANDHWTEVRVSFGGIESITMKVERMNSSGSNPRPTDYNTSLTQSSDLARAGKRVNFTYERDDTSITFRWPASTIPPTATCFHPAVTTSARAVVSGRTTQAGDSLEISPHGCAAQNIRTEGLDGTCPAPASARVKAVTIQDARDDVGERDNLQLKPHDNATLDILSLDQRVEDGWVVQTITLAEASPRDQVDLEIEAQYKGNVSQFDRGAFALVSLLGTGGSGSLLGEGNVSAFHVRAERVEPAGWELRWCASLIPADAECFQIFARATLGKDYVDATPRGGEACPEPDEEGSTDAARDDEEGGSAAAPEAEPTKDAPGPGALGALAVAGLAALALRRRA